MPLDEDLRRLASEAPKRPWSLRRINDGAHPFAIISPNGPHGDVILLGNIDEATARIIASLEAQLAEAREGLRPLGRLDFGKPRPGTNCGIFTIMHSDILRAQRVLSTPAPDYAKSIKEKAYDQIAELCSDVDFAPGHDRWSLGPFISAMKDKVP